MNHLNLSSQDRVLRAIECGITAPSKIAQRTGLSDFQVANAVANLKGNGRLVGVGRDLRPAGACLLAVVWR